MSVAGGRFKFSRGDSVLGPRYTKYTPVGAASDLNDELMGWAPRTRCDFIEDFTGAQPVTEIRGAMFSAGGAANQIAVANASVTIVPFRVMRAGILTAASLVVEDALLASDANYLTFTLVNTGNSGAGTTPMLLATDVNTTKATLGTGLTAVTGRSLTLNATAANLRVAAGDVLILTATVTGTLANVVDFPVARITLSTLPASVTPRTTKTVGLLSAAPVANTAHGEALFALGATNEANVTGFDWGDQVLIPANARPIFQARMKFSGVATVTRAVWGLASAYNATFDTTTNNAWFRWEGNALDLFAEVDDDTTNTDDTDSTFDLVADTYYLFTVDMTDKGAIRFSVDETCYLEVAGAVFASTHLLQPVVWLQKDSGTGAQTITCDYVRCTWDRSV